MQTTILAVFVESLCIPVVETPTADPCAHYTLFTLMDTLYRHIWCMAPHHVAVLLMSTQTFPGSM